VSMPSILVPLPSRDFDPTEVGVPGSHLLEQGFDLAFATPDGKPAQADPIMVTGKGLGLLAGALMARRQDIALYTALIRRPAFLNPVLYHEARESDFMGLLLPGGHAKGMRTYLESADLQRLVADFFKAGKPVAAICHGVLLAARSKDSAGGVSVLHGRKTTGLLKRQEMLAWQLTRAWMADYYRTYGTPMQTEVESFLAAPGDFIAGPLPLFRDSFQKPEHGFFLKDGNYLSARWPGDAHAFALALPEHFGG